MNLAGIIDPHPAGALALVTGSDAVTTYGELRRAVAGEHTRLVEAAIKADDRVAILSANTPAFVVAYLAVLRAGAVAVPLNIVSPPAELQRQLAQVDVAAILVGPGAIHVAGALEHLTGVHVLTVGGTPTPPPPEAAAPAAPAAAPADPETAAQLEPAAPPLPPDAVDRAPDDLAALLFTAGTAGSPRAAMLTHGNLLSNLEQVQRHPGPTIGASDRVLAVLPLCHIFGLNAVLGEALFVGASVVLLDRFEPARTLELIARHQVTIVIGAPTLFSALTAATSVGDNPMASVRYAFSGAAPLSPEVAEAWHKRFGLALRQGYGLTEAAPVVTATLARQPGRSASIGVPLPGVEVQLIDEDGEETLAGDPGEIWVKGPNVFPGYWHDPDATAAALTADGWLRTGDIAVVGDDGELAIVDRAKDLIIVSGFNVYPAEVEEALAEHPGVADAAVVGDPDRYRGEQVHAFVVARDPAHPPTAAELKTWCATRLAHYKCPTAVTFLPALPHGLAGKLLRRSLRSA